MHVFYRLASKENDFKVDDERVPLLTQSFFTCGSNVNCKEVAKEAGKGQFKEVTGPEANGEDSVSFKKMIGKKNFELKLVIYLKIVNKHHNYC